MGVRFNTRVLNLAIYTPEEVKNLEYEIRLLF